MLRFAFLGFDYYLLLVADLAWLLLLEEVQGLEENVCELLSHILFVLSFFVILL